MPHSLSALAAVPMASTASIKNHVAEVALAVRPLRPYRLHWKALRRLAPRRNGPKPSVPPLKAVPLDQALQAAPRKAFLTPSKSAPIQRLYFLAAPD